VAQKLIASAELVVGGKRHLGLANGLIRGRRLAWPSPIDAALPEIEKHRGRPSSCWQAAIPFITASAICCCARSRPTRRFACRNPRPSVWRPPASAGRCRMWRW